MSKHGINKKRFIIPLLAASGLVGVLAGALVAFTWDLPQIRSLETFRPSAVTRVFSSDRILLAEWFAERRDPVPFHLIPDDLKQAVITTEDRSFYTHSGVDLKGILRAIVKDIRAGEFVEGASTITQQLAKTLFLTPQKKLERKIKEAILAFQLERRYTKDEILGLYLNQIYFGSGAYGVQSAAHRYFGKPVSDLDLAQCALIAAMPKAPSRYSPRVNPALAVKRRNIVLKQLRTTGNISEKAYLAAVAAPLALADNMKKPKRAPYFTDYVKVLLENKVGTSTLYKGGLTVTTTLDFSLQSMAERSVRQGLVGLTQRMEKRGAQPEDPQSALICLDVQTGGILAMVGGENYNESSFNRASDAHRQPGSAFKPLVYALAVEKGMAQSRLILDAPVVYKGARDGGDWQPDNFSHSYLGEMTLRKALALSQNIPAVRLTDILGPAAVAEFGKTFGIRTRLDPNLSLALGTSETTLIEMTSAYTVFANRGKRAEPFAVRTVVDPLGRVVWENELEGTVVMSREGAAIMVDLLQGVIREGTGRRARGLQHPVAGKTGTTNGYKDALFLGFSPTLATGVWVGRDRFVTLGNGETGARAALPIWMDFMENALETRSYEHFDVPDGVVRVWMNTATGAHGEKGDADSVRALFKTGTEPPAY